MRGEGAQALTPFVGIKKYKIAAAREEGIIVLETKKPFQVQRRRGPADFVRVKGKATLSGRKINPAWSLEGKTENQHLGKKKGTRIVNQKKRPPIEGRPTGKVYMSLVRKGGKCSPP